MTYPTKQDRAWLALAVSIVIAAVASYAASDIVRIGLTTPTAPGLFFTALFVGRGFGIAVGAHAGYDVLVGLTAG